VATEAVASDETGLIKKTTTVAMDYGVLNLPGGEKVMLYGTPGQERFNFMWEILSEGGIGLVLLINNANPDPLADLQGYLHAFKDFISKTAVTIGVTHMDRAEAPDLDAYRTRLASLGHQPPPAVFRVDARSRDDVAMLVKALLYTLNPGLIDA
jgi:signal recognition particle receptor subunit beta